MPARCQANTVSVLTRPPPLAARLPACPPARPRAGQPSTYLLGRGQLQEVNWVKSQFSSWFAGDSVLQGAACPLEISSMHTNS